jgi:hypothetical protein
MEKKKSKTKEEPPKPGTIPAAGTVGHIVGLKGGPERAAKLSSKERREIEKKHLI